MFGQPVMVFAAGAAHLARTPDRALSRERLDLAGIAIRADRKTVDKITARLRLHP